VLRPYHYDIELGMVDIAEPDVLTGVETFVGEPAAQHDGKFPHEIVPPVLHAELRSPMQMWPPQIVTIHGGGESLTIIVLLVASF
jgi:hypothetical protein